jgi:sugar phosphate isomerase/epimerase
MKYSVFTVLLGDRSVADAAATVARLGYDGIEWRVHPDYHLPVDTIKESAQEAKRISESEGLDIPMLSTYLKLDQASDIVLVAEAAAAISCPAVRVWPPEYDGTRSAAQAIDHTRRLLTGVSGKCAHLPVRLCLEIHMGTIIPSPSLALRVVEESDPDRVGVIYDPGNMVHEGFENHRLGIELLGEYLAHVHAKNAAWQRDESGRWTCEWARLQDGIADWPAVMQVLQDKGYSGWISNENFCDTEPVEQRLAGDLAYLRGIEAEGRDG